MSRRVKVVAAFALAALAVGVVAAYGALGTYDTPTGTGALASENGGDYNTADGYQALTANTTGINNGATGAFALYSNTTGQENTATGEQALDMNVTGGWNTADGMDALYLNTTGYNNTATGTDALFSNTTGTDNTAVGMNAGRGDHPNTTGSNNSFLGFNAAPGIDTEIDNATAIGAFAVVSQSNSIVLGAPGVNVGVQTATPQSRVQIGNGASATWGDYLQLPVVTNTAKTPPSGDCNSTTLVGRMVLQQVKKKLVLWGCSSAGVWVKI